MAPALGLWPALDRLGRARTAAFYPGANGLDLPLPNLPITTIQNAGAAIAALRLLRRQQRRGRRHPRRMARKDAAPAPWPACDQCAGGRAVAADGGHNDPAGGEAIAATLADAAAQDACLISGMLNSQGRARLHAPAGAAGRPPLGGVDPGKRTPCRLSPPATPPATPGYRPSGRLVAGALRSHRRDQPSGPRADLRLALSRR